MESLQQIIDLFLHLDDHLRDVIRDYGAWTYLLEEGQRSEWQKRAHWDGSCH